MLSTMMTSTLWVPLTSSSERWRWNIATAMTKSADDALSSTCCAVSLKTPTSLRGAHVQRVMMTLMPW
jgi:hypothetical protein